MLTALCVAHRTLLLAVLLMTQQPPAPATAPTTSPTQPPDQQAQKAASPGSDVRYQPVVDPERTQQADTLSQREVNGLPINRRNYVDLATLTPGVVTLNDNVGITELPLEQLPNSRLSFGNNGRGNVFWLDGAENYVNSGGARPSMSQEAVAEFHIDRLNFSAEFGGGIGGIVNIVSRAGSDDLHGSLFGFVRDSRLQARNYFDLGKTAFTRTQAGATLGGPIGAGPIRKGRTSFFLAFERLQQNETRYVPVTRDPSLFTSLTSSQQQLLNGLDAIGGELAFLAASAQQYLITANFPQTLALFKANSGDFPFAARSTQGSARIDHQFTDNHHGFWRFNATGSADQTTPLDAILGYSRGNHASLSDEALLYNDTWVLSDKLVSEFRLELNRYVYALQPQDQFGPALEINGYGQFGRDPFLPSHYVEWQGQAQENLFYTAGRHSIRFGASANPVHDTTRVDSLVGGTFFFSQVIPLATGVNQIAANPNASTLLAAALTAAGKGQLTANLNDPITSLQAFNLGLPTFYTQYFGSPSWEGWFKRFAGYVNDVYRVHDRLTLNAGLRYDGEVGTAFVGTTGNFAPRVGLAWTPFANRKTVIRAGYGLFYSQTSSLIIEITGDFAGHGLSQVLVPLTGLPGTKNPLTGQLLTSADVYNTLLAQGVIGHRAIAPSDLAQFGIQVGPNLPIVNEVLPPTHWQSAYSEQASYEMEHAFGGTSVSVAYNFIRGVHLPRLSTIPTPSGLTGNIASYAQFESYQPEADSFYHALIVQAARRFSQRVTFNVHYTFSKSINEVTDLDVFVADNQNPRADRGLSAFDQRHRLVGSAILDLPGSGKRQDGWKQAIFGGFVLAPVVSANSGRAFNIVTGNDFAQVQRPIGAGRDIGHGPAYCSADARLSRELPLSERFRLEVIAEGFNLLNKTNFNQVNNIVGLTPLNQLPQPIAGFRGNLTDPLSFISAFNARQFQLALKLHF